MIDPTLEQIEAAARALWAGHGLNGEWDAGTHEAHELCREDARAALVAAAGAALHEANERHYIYLVIEDNEVRTRLRCEAVETAPCRMRPENWEAMESWTEEECVTSGHPCWAVKFIEDGGDEQLYGTDQVLGRVPVTVEYADGVEVCATRAAAPEHVDEAKLAEAIEWARDRSRNERDIAKESLGQLTARLLLERRAEWLRGGGQ